MAIWRDVWRLPLLSLTFVAAGLAIAVATGAGTVAAQTVLKPLSANDLSILFPSPQNAADMV
jgi:hypothetical protein